eukprot:TRINITY_DN1665_c0_g1_i2.p1 TRINITY_DN1665_c0_g1~~TRINITY_DN1665_c0_g1_i2.p1  ORF type:complete len:135 (+),score=20.07 TRINITY_DN1665_c0_g1_i2:336-740(+)
MIVSNTLLALRKSTLPRLTVLRERSLVRSSKLLGEHRENQLRRLREYDLRMREIKQATGRLGVEVEGLGNEELSMQMKKLEKVTVLLGVEIARLTYELLNLTPENLAWIVASFTPRQYQIFEEELAYIKKILQK